MKTRQVDMCFTVWWFVDCCFPGGLRLKALSYVCGVSCSYVFSLFSPIVSLLKYIELHTVHVNFLKPNLENCRVSVILKVTLILVLLVS